MDASNHYEAAFRAYLQANGLCYVAVNEAQRVPLGDEPVKSLDFIVYGEGGARLLVDVKGRRFPSGARGRYRRVWECWATADDVRDLQRWAARFGPGHVGLLVFAYQMLRGTELPAGSDDLWTWGGRRYLFRGVAVDDYRRHLRVRSPRWGTVGLPSAAYRELARPFNQFALGPQAACR